MLSDGEAFAPSVRIQRVVDALGPRGRSSTGCVNSHSDMLATFANMVVANLP